MSDTGTPEQVEVVSKYPWYIQVLDKHGITTLFSLVLLYGGYVLGLRHLEFLDGQTVQMKQQTTSLETIARSSIRQEQALDKVSDSLEEGNTEHKRILEKLK